MQTFITTALHVVEYWKEEREREMLLLLLLLLALLPKDRKWRPECECFLSRPLIKSTLFLSSL